MPKWEKPKILQMDALPSGLGHCADGSTPSSVACANGQDTGGPHDCRQGGNGASFNHIGCDSGSEIVVATS
jgi:hypothetical protein